MFLPLFVGNTCLPGNYLKKQIAQELTLLVPDARSNEFLISVQHLQYSGAIKQTLIAVVIQDALHVK